MQDDKTAKGVADRRRPDRTARYRSARLIGRAAIVSGSMIAHTAAAQAPVFAIQTPPALATLDESLRSVAAVSTTDAWAVGGNITAHWIGASWAQVAIPSTKADLADVSAFAAGDVWAVGTLSHKDASPTALVLLWNGQSWATMPTPPVSQANVSFTTVVAIAANNVWVAGSVNFYNENLVEPIVENWNGTTWSVTPLPFPGAFIEKMAAVSATDIWVVGESVGGGTVQFLPFSAHWNGTQWSQVTVPALTYGGRLAGVVALSAKNVWAVGSSTLPPIYTNSLKTVSYNPVQNLIEHWNGKAWSINPSPNVGPIDVYQTNQLYAITALSATNLWAVGSFKLPDGSDRQLSLALHGNGTSWSVAPVPDVGLNNILFGATAVAPSTLWLVGAGNFPNLISGAGPLIASASGG
jgi:hypothetical protein